MIYTTKLTQICSVNANDFCKAIAIASQVATTDSHPLLQYLLIDVAAIQMVITALHLSSWSQTFICKIGLSANHQPLQFMVLSESLRKLCIRWRQWDSVELEVCTTEDSLGHDCLVLKGLTPDSNKFEFILMGPPPTVGGVSSFPDPDIILTEQASAEVDAAAFMLALQKVAIAMSTDKTRGCLCGVKLESDSTQLQLTATDGHAAAYTKITNNGTSNFVGIVDSSTVKILCQILAREAGGVQIKVGRTSYAQDFISFEAGKYFLCSKVIEAKLFPTVSKLLVSAMQSPSKLVGRCQNLLASVERMLAVSDKNQIVFLLSDNGDVGAYARHGDVVCGEAIEMTASGDEILFAVNGVKLQKALKALSDTEGEIEVYLNQKIGLIRAGECCQLVAAVEVRGNLEFPSPATLKPVPVADLESVVEELNSPEPELELEVQTVEVEVAEPVDEPLQEVAPFFARYQELKRRYSEHILLAHAGDFYEAYYEDAHQLAAALDFVLTSKPAGATRAPMCGLPDFSLEKQVNYLTTLGYSVAIADYPEQFHDNNPQIEVVRVIEVEF